MVKPDPNRDYYADLEVAPNADLQDIKKQYKKLALKHHPDRNPGKDQSEVNARFQIIQSAHEILIDGEQRRAYDIARAKRYGAGKKGNPWSNYGSDFPPPPKRGAPTAQKPATGANRYRGFQNAPAPQGKAQTRDDRAEEATAFEKMKPKSNRTSRTQPSSSSTAEPRAPNPTSTPHTPRTASARQKQEASFGNKKPGYYPSSPVGGDEGPASSKGYSTAANRFREGVAKAAAKERQGNEKSDDVENILDSRQSTPYHHTHAGEKLNPFERPNEPNPDVPIRSGSTREPPSQEGRLNSGKTHFSDQRPRSSSDINAGSQSRDTTRPHRSGEQSDANGASFAPRRARASQPNDGYNTQSSQGSGNTPMYGIYHSTCSATQRVNIPYSGNATNDVGFGIESSIPPDTWASSCGPELFPIEKTQKWLLEALINGNSHGDGDPGTTRMNGSKAASTSHPSSHARTNGNPVDRFDMHDDMPPPPPKSRSPFMSSSAEGMSTRFTTEGDGPFQFSAGSGAGRPVPRRSQSNSRLGRQSRKPGHPDAEAGFVNGSGQNTPVSEPRKSAFDAQGWTEKFVPQDFAPQPSKTTSQSPTRANRANSRKSKTRPTMGNAAMTNESSADDDVSGRHNEPVNMDSPNAMDIDSPPREHEPAKPKANSRNIPVEPSNPEWRAGTAAESKGRRSSQAQVGPAPFKVPTGGSEDSEEFKTATFAGWKSPGLFTSLETGLKGFPADMKATLPFESGPSESIPIKTERPMPRPLELESAPHAPTLPGPLGIKGMRPTTEAMQRYLKEFQEYLVLWENWSTIVINHFWSRQQQLKEQRIADERASNGRNSLSQRGVRDQLTWAIQDKAVRAKWAEACNNHETRLEEYMTVLKHK